MQISNSFTVRAALLVAGATNIAAFWRMPCRARSGLARIDPLVNNGSLSGHAHAIHGSSGFSTTAGYDALMAGSCTSCQVSQDKSAYWTPAVYFKSAATGEYTLVDQVGGMLAYYLLYPNVGNSSLSAFPAEFEMIAGDTNQRNFTYPVPDIPKSFWTGVYSTQAFLRQAAVGFNCLNYGKTPEGSLYRHFLPDKAYLDANCVDGVRFELMFPSCWNGRDVTSPNKKDHVAYPSQVMTGNCPDGFPERLPSLFYETIWNTYAFNGQDGEFIIANGDPTGYGYHGDFMMGWDHDFLQSAVNTCTNLSGQIEDCPLFNIQSTAAYSNCDITLPGDLVKENVLGALATLPGNPAINSGPGYGNAATAGGANSDPPPAAATTQAGPPPAKPSLGYSAGSSVASTDTYVPGAIFAASVPAVPVQEAASTPAPAAATTSPAPSYFATSYTTIGREVVEVLWIEEVVTVTASETTILTVPGKKRDHLHRHKLRHAVGAEKHYH